ncbi:MAG: LacI family transcriptional regulator [Actinobacteria bacterium]|nr:LacI family transcriptional regulator [Actinomycetota bacterium]
MKKKITINDVATEAGVSIATVSRVLNKDKNVKNETMVKVTEVIDRLGYHANAMARSLRKKKSYTIGIIVGNVLSPFYSMIAKAVEDTALKYSYNVILCNGGDDPDKELAYLKVLQEKQVEGIILTPSGKNESMIKKVLERNVYMVLLDRRIKNIQCDSVMIDNVKSAYQAVSFLIEQGFNRIGIICGPQYIQTGKERLEGYFKALSDAGIYINNDLIKIGTFKKESGKELVGELLDLKDKPDAIFVCNIDMTTGALLELKERKVRIPDDISLMGFDDPDWAGFVEPPLTTVSQPVYILGTSAAELLMQRIKGENVSDSPVNITLDTSLVIRESVKLKNF